MNAAKRTINSTPMAPSPFPPAPMPTSSLWRVLPVMPSLRSTSGITPSTSVVCPKVSLPCVPSIARASPTASACSASSAINAVWTRRDASNLYLRQIQLVSASNTVCICVKYTLYMPQIQIGHSCSFASYPLFLFFT